MDLFAGVRPDGVIDQQSGREIDSRVTARRKGRHRGRRSADGGRLTRVGDRTSDRLQRADQ
jgi:hypothetical protein